MIRKHSLLAIMLMVVCILSVQQYVSAAVSLLYFSATPGSNTIDLEWKTATELDVIAFRVYRSETEVPADWGTPITVQAAEGDVITGHTYSYSDTAVIEGVRYYYLLREETSTGEYDVHQVISAGIGLPTDTPTVTATVTSTRTPQVQRVFTTPTITPLRPTATRKFTDAPPTAVPTTAGPQATATAAMPRVPTRTPLPVARVATPTGPAPRVTLPAAPFVSPLLPTPTQVVRVAQITATSTFSAPAVSSEAQSPTPLPTKDLTPVIFSAETPETSSAASEDTGQVARQGSRSTTLGFVLGGGAVGLAAMLVAVLLFLRSRRP